jgi:hypothetical protein
MPIDKNVETVLFCMVCTAVIQLLATVYLRRC